jgi:nucleolar MIF4G domain-containing protein 1
MIETIINLKNNRAKTSTSSSVVTSTATVRMKKFLGRLSEKSGLRSAGDPLRVSLEDIRQVKGKGKWWLVGASWKGDERGVGHGEGVDEEEGLVTLAREQRMNTEIRRAVFVALMGSEVLPPHDVLTSRTTSTQLRESYSCH